MNAPNWWDAPRHEPSTASVLLQLLLIAVAAAGLGWGILVGLVTAIGFPFSMLVWPDDDRWAYAGFIVAAAAVAALYGVRALDRRRPRP